MKQKQHILHSLTIEVMAVLLASMIAFQVCNMLGIRMSLLPFVMATGYIILKLLYHLCIIVARYIIEAIPSSHFALANEKTDTSSSVVLPHLQKIVSKFRRNEWSYFTMNTNVSNSNTSSEKKKRKTKN